MADWPHAPVHRLEESGAYMVTAGTHYKRHVFTGSERLSLLQDHLLSLAPEYGWRLQAWAVFPNHYHFIAVTESDPKTLVNFIRRLHALTAAAVNAQDGEPGRKVWFQYWDTHLTFQASYMARLKYVHLNPVHHGLVAVATDYEWCSARWLEETAPPAFAKSVSSFPTDRLLHIRDDF
jgi:putative transposase